MPPEGLATGIAAALVALSFLSSALTACVGAGGGLLLLGVLASVLPTGTVIPVHALVQLGSSSGRTLLARRSIVMRVAAWLLAGAGLGTVAGSRLLFRLPGAWLDLAIGLFILLIVWAPAVRATGRSVLATLVFGTVCGFLSLFVGATGPLVNAYIQRLVANRHETVATMAACLTGMNLMKLTVFTLAGFAWREWAGLVLVMIASGFAGTALGLRLLGRLSEALFRQALRGVLTALALNLCYRGWVALVA